MGNGALLKHLKIIFIHRRYVRHYCFMCGLYWQGLVHDLSKYSFVELSESVKYYTGTSSPIDECKKVNSYSLAWQHHKSHNKHHYEYWTDNYDTGTTAIKMPWKYALEMVCDYLGAGKAYNSETFSIKSEIKWWDEKREVALMHEDTKWLIDVLFQRMKRYGIEDTLGNHEYLKELKSLYQDERKTPSFSYGDISDNSQRVRD